MAQSGSAGKWMGVAAVSAAAVAAGALFLWGKPAAQQQQEASVLSERNHSLEEQLQQ